MLKECFDSVRQRKGHINGTVSAATIYIALKDGQLAKLFPFDDTAPQVLKVLRKRGAMEMLSKKAFVELCRSVVDLLQARCPAATAHCATVHRATVCRQRPPLVVHLDRA